MKRRIADGSVGSPHVRVGHRQALIPNPRVLRALGFFYGRRQDSGSRVQLYAGWRSRLPDNR